MDMRQRILLVDDEPELRRMVASLLTGAGYEVLEAADCAQARAAMAARRPDAVLLDVMLPDGDGFSLLPELRRSGDVPVLYLSARDEDAARLQGLGLGADDYITKPFLPQELLLRLGAVLRRVYGGRQADDALPLGPATVHWGTGTVTRPSGGALPHRQGVRPAEKAGGQPGKHRHHRRPVRRPLGRPHGGV